MHRQNIYKKQQLKFMVLNFIAFTSIFAIFGIIIFSQVQNTLYSKTDEELFKLKEKISLEAMFNERRSLTDFSAEHGIHGLEREQINPRIIVLSWNENGEIVNQNQIGTLYYESYLQGYKPDFENVNLISSMTINDLFHFRYLLFEDVNDSDDIAYTQLLMNVDAEQTILNNFGRLIIICSIIFIVLSLSASYILSKKMMEPIIASWNKQTEFVENASHELRTPLTVIQNKLEMLLTTPQAKIADKFENIALSLSETRRLSKLTNDLLTLARADSQETQLVMEPISVVEFIRSVCEPYQEIAALQEKQLHINLNCHVTMQGDKERLHQLLVILLDNALKYTREKDTITVNTYLEDQKVVIEVADSGIGINEENLQTIFDRFYREDKARSRETGGVGLGLSIAKWIVDMHGGTIVAFRNEQSGTTFKVKLPQ